MHKAFIKQPMEHDALYVQAFKEQQKQIENLQSENEKLKEQLQQYQALEARISALEEGKNEGVNLVESSEKK